MKLTEDQLHELQRIIDDHHAAFVANYVSPGAVPRDVLDRIKALGLVNVKVNSAREAYTLGVLAARLGADASLQALTYPELRERLRREPVALSAAEQQAVQNAQLSAGQYIRGIGVRMGQYAGAQALQTDEASRQALIGQVRSETEAALAQRKGVGELVTALGHATLDFTRDMRRVANTELHQAMQTGTADAILREHGGGALVSKLAASTCCDACRRLFDNVDGTPRMFELSELLANGTNVGRKQDDWQAVAGAVHPNCRCQLVRIPGPGWTFNADRLLVPPGAKA